MAVNLADGDFLSDGASPGSGAVNFQPDSMIRVPATKSWRPLGGMRAEVVCIRDVLWALVNPKVTSSRTSAPLGPHCRAGRGGNRRRAPAAAGFNGQGHRELRRPGTGRDTCDG